MRAEALLMTHLELHASPLSCRRAAELELRELHDLGLTEKAHIQQLMARRLSSADSTATIGATCTSGLRPRCAAQLVMALSLRHGTTGLLVQALVKRLGLRPPGSTAGPDDQEAGAEDDTDE